jgi:hypothetical protein
VIKEVVGGLVEGGCQFRCHCRSCRLCRGGFDCRRACFKVEFYRRGKASNMRLFVSEAEPAMEGWGLGQLTHPCFVYELIKNLDQIDENIQLDRFLETS